MIYIYTTWISKQKYIQAHPGPLSQGPEGGPPESSILAKFWRPGHSKVPFFRYLYDPNVPQLGQWMDNFYGQLMDISKKTWINNVEIMRKYGESWIFLYISMDMMWKLFLKIWTYPWIFRYISMNRIWFFFHMDVPLTDFFVKGGNCLMFFSLFDVWLTMGMIDFGWFSTCWKKWSEISLVFCRNLMF